MNSKVIVFMGENNLEKENAAQKYIDTFINAHGNMSVDKFNGDDLETSSLINALTSIPFLSERRLVIVRDLSINKSVAQSVESLLKKIANTTDFIIIEDKIDKRSKYLSQLKTLAQIREFTSLDAKGLVDFILLTAKIANAQISKCDANYLIDRLGNNQQLLHNELQKLILFDKQITQNNINALTLPSPKSSIFNLIDSAFSRDIKSSIAIYEDQRAQGAEPLSILGMLGWQLHILSVIKAAGNKEITDIASESKINIFLIRKNASTAKKITYLNLQKLIIKTIDVDKQLKTNIIDADLAIKNLLIEYSATI